LTASPRKMQAATLLSIGELLQCTLSSASNAALQGWRKQN